MKKTILSMAATIAAVCFVTMFAQPAAHAQFYEVVHTFSGPDGASPIGGLIQDASGNYYGVTLYDGSSNPFGGTIFKASWSGPWFVLTTLYSFTGGSDGSSPYGPLVRDAAGNLYGTTSGGGAHNDAGTIFKLSPNGVLTTLYSFTGGTDGLRPNGPMIRDATGGLYGTTSSGGEYGYGTVFWLSPGGLMYTRYSFTGGADGWFPSGPLVLDSAGNLYGTAAFGGSFAGGYCITQGCGTIFKWTPGRAGRNLPYLTVLHTFTGGADGYEPLSGLIQDAAGYLYGAASQGAQYDAGTIFEVSSTGSFFTLYTFTGQSDGGGPVTPLVRDAAGNLYGATEEGGEGYGTVFEWSPPPGWFQPSKFTVLHAFTGAANLTTPSSGALLLDNSGDIYGTAPLGGSSNPGRGVIFGIIP